MLAEIIKKHRIEAGLTQQEVAEHLHVTRQAVSGRENNKSYPDIPTLISLSDYYGISLDLMLKGDEAYMEKVKSDAEKLTYLKKKIYVSLLPVLIMLGLLVLLQVTDAEQNTQLWRLLFLFTRIGILAYCFWVGLTLKQVNRLSLRTFLGLCLTLLVLILRFLEPLFILPYSGIIYWSLQLGAILLICSGILIQQKK